MPASQCVQVNYFSLEVRDMMHNCSIQVDADWRTGAGSTNANNTKTAGIELVYAGPHCHAPNTCLSTELYNADTGSLLCHSSEPIRGQSDELYDEHGFLSIPPPCLWGDSMTGLMASELLSLDTTLLSIKRNNKTLGHR